MPPVNIGEIVVSLGLDLSEYTKGVEKAKAEASRLSSELNKQKRADFRVLDAIGKQTVANEKYVQNEILKQQDLRRKTTLRQEKQLNAILKQEEKKESQERVRRERQEVAQRMAIRKHLTERFMGSERVDKAHAIALVENERRDTLVENKAAREQMRIQRERMSIERDHAIAVKENIRWSVLQNKITLDGNARFGVMANTVSGLSSTLHLLTGEAGFFVIEMGRAGLYLGRATTAAGGLIASLHTLKATMGAFLTTIGPIGWVLLGITAGFAALRAAEEEADEATKELEESLKSVKKEVQNLGLELAKITGKNFEGLSLSLDQIRLKELQNEIEGFEDLHPTQQLTFNIQAEEQIKREKALEEVKRVAELSKQDLSTMPDSWKFWDELNAKEVERGEELRRQRLDAVKEEGESRKKMYEDAFNVALEHIEQQRDLINQIGITGEAIKKSDTLFGLEREAALIQERFEAGKKALEGRKPFGISTQSSRAFRFGTGPIGSTIGEQTEQRRTTEAVKHLEETFKQEMRNLYEKAQGDLSSLERFALDIPTG